MSLIIFKIICIIFGCYCVFKMVRDIPLYFTEKGRESSEYTQNDLLENKKGDLPSEFDRLVLNIVNFILLSWVIIQVALGVAVMYLSTPFAPDMLMWAFKIVWIIWGTIAFIFEGLHIFKGSDYKMSWKVMCALSVSSAIYYALFVVVLLTTFN